MLVHFGQSVEKLVCALGFLVEVSGFFDETLGLALPSTLFQYFGYGSFIEVPIKSFHQGCDPFLSSSRH
jgi:hypothetical protein